MVERKVIVDRKIGARQLIKVESGPVCYTFTTFETLDHRFRFVLTSGVFGETFVLADSVFPTLEKCSRKLQRFLDACLSGKERWLEDVMPSRSKGKEVRYV